AIIPRHDAVRTVDGERRFVQAQHIEDEFVLVLRCRASHTGRPFRRGCASQGARLIVASLRWPIDCPVVASTCEFGRHHVRRAEGYRACWSIVYTTGVQSGSSLWRAPHPSPLPEGEGARGFA